MAKAIATLFNPKTGTRKVVYEGEKDIWSDGSVLENEENLRKYGFQLDPANNRQLVRTQFTPDAVSAALPKVPTIDEAQKEAVGTKAYQEQSSLIGAQKTAQEKALADQEALTQKSFAEERASTQSLFKQERAETAQTFEESRQQLLTSFQDAMDQINAAAKEVGLRTRVGASQRELYNASGELSGIGQNVAAKALEPITRNIKQIATRQQQNISNLGVRETQAMSGLTLKEQQAVNRLGTQEQSALQKINAALAQIPIEAQQQTLSLRDKIVSSIIKSAEENRDIAFKGIQEQQKYMQDLEEKQADFQRKVDLEVLKASLRGTKATTRSTGNGTTQSVSTGDGYKVTRNYDRSTGSYTGLTFKDPKGVLISPYEFANNVGKSLPEVLAGSGDAGDQQFIQDFNQLKSYVGQPLPDGRVLTEQMMLQELAADYPHIFGISQGERSSF